MYIYIYTQLISLVLLLQIGEVIINGDVHACNPSTLEAEAGGLQVEASLDYTVKSCLKTNKNKT
jgi:hypothetical protein